MFSSNLLEQVRRVAQEVPSSTLDALIQALMAVNHCEVYRDLFADVRSFEAFKYFHLGMISELPRKTGSAF